MVQITSLVAVVAVLAGQALAIKNCVSGQIYCGGTLLREPDFRQWQTAVDNALRAAGQVPITGSLESDSIFRCNADTTTLTFVDWCKNPSTHPSNFLCQPNNSRKCTGLNDCCAA